MVLGIVMSLFMLSSADFSPFLQKHTASTTTSRLFHHLAFARSEAIKRNKIVTISPKENGYMISSGQDILLQEETTPLTFNAIHYTPEGRSLTRTTIKIAQNQKIVIYDSGRARIVDENIKGI